MLAIKVHTYIFLIFFFQSIIVSASDPEECTWNNLTSCETQHPTDPEYHRSCPPALMSCGGLILIGLDVTVVGTTIYAAMHPNCDGSACPTPNNSTSILPHTRLQQLSHFERRMQAFQRPIFKKQVIQKAKMPKIKTGKGAQRHR